MGACLLYYTRPKRNYNEIVENLLADPSNFPAGYDIINFSALGPDREREGTLRGEPMKTNEEVWSIVNALKELYPDGLCSLEYEKDYELLFSVRLAAQCTDERVNKVTPALFARFPTLEALAGADVAEVEQYIHSTGFFRAKARDIVRSAQMLLSDYGGKVPGTMEELLKLPGVGRKTANLILGDVYHTPGVVVADTHCIRISGKLGLTDGTKDPVKVEQQLRAILPPEESNDFCHRLVLHGRAVCTARKPYCERCSVRAWCDTFHRAPVGTTEEG